MKHHLNSSVSNIKFALIINAIFVLVEFAGVIITNSVAILSDAIHDLGDVLSLSIAWYLQRKAEQESDYKYSYGYKRFSLLGTVFLSAILIVSSIFVISVAIKRLFHPEMVDAGGMILIAIFGVIMNGAAVFRLKRGSSLNEKAVYIHMMEDILGWVAVLIVAVVMKFYNLPILDPIFSIIIAIWVMFNVHKNLRETFRILLQAVPKNISISKLEKEILSIKNVVSVHDIHIWSQDGESHVMTIHVVTNTKATELIMEQILNIVKPLKIEHITVQFDSLDCKS